MMIMFSLLRPFIILSYVILSYGQYIHCLVTIVTTHLASLFSEVYSNHKMLGINVQSLNMKNSPTGLHTMSGKNGVSNS